MLSKKEVKDIQSLSLKKHRDETKLFIAEGPRMVEELLRIIPRQIETVYVTEAAGNRFSSIQNQVLLKTVSTSELEKLSGQKTPNNVLAVVRQFDHPGPVNPARAVYLDGIQDPGNLGTIIRTADWFGIADVICSRGCADLYNPKVVQSTMGSIARVKVYYDDGSWLKEQQTAVYAATLDGTSLYEMPPVEEGIIVIGNEAKGVSSEILSLAQFKIKIPGRGGAESLNAAVAAGIILSNLLR